MALQSFRIPHVLRHGSLPASAHPPSLLRSYGVTSASAWQPPFFISRCCIKKLTWQTKRLAKPKFFLRKNGGWSFFGSNLVAYFDVLFETNFGSPKMQHLYNSSHIRYLPPKFEQNTLVKGLYPAREIRGIALALSRVYKKSRPLV